MKMIFNLLLFFLMVDQSWALDVDEKLTLRFLKVSNSKKTVLINRGAEDGLVLGDHAKFFITEGVVARGMVEKVSPTRSIWALYRIIDPSMIVDGKALNLKTQIPAKVTEDSTKSSRIEEVGIEVENVTTADLEEKVNNSEEVELEGMLEEDSNVSTKKNTPTKSLKKRSKMPYQNEIEVVEDLPVRSGRSLLKNMEIFGNFYLSSLSGTVSNNTASNGSTANTFTSVDFSAGLEYYFFKWDNFLKDFSVQIFVDKKSTDIGQDVKINTSWYEFGLGSSYHFLNSPSAIYRMIGFLNVGFGIGKGDVKETTTTSGVAVVTDIQAAKSFFSVGLGAKYILNNGFGFRSILDYYHSSEQLLYTSGATVDRSLAGPRILLGLSYRF